MDSDYLPNFMSVECPHDDCDWIGDITKLVVVRESSKEAMYCLCPECVGIVFEEYQPNKSVLKSATKLENGDSDDIIQDQGHSAQPVQESRILPNQR